MPETKTNKKNKVEARGGKRNGLQTTLFEHLDEPCLKLDHSFNFPVTGAVDFSFAFLWLRFDFILPSLLGIRGMEYPICGFSFFSLLPSQLLCENALKCLPEDIDLRIGLESP